MKGSRNAKKQTVSNGKSTSQENKLGASLAAVKNLVSGNENLSGLANGLIAAQESFEAADSAKKEKISASLETDIQALVGELKKSLDEAKNADTENKKCLARTKQLEENAENLKKDLDHKEKEISKNEGLLLIDKKKVSVDRADIAKRLRELEEKELDAENGFAKKNMEMLESFKSEKLVLVSKLEEEKIQLLEMIEQLKLNKESLTEENKQYWQIKQAELTSREDKVTDRELKLKRDFDNFERKIKELEFKREDVDNFKEELKEVVKTEFIQQLSSLENQKNNLEKQIEKYKSIELEQLRKLSAFKEIERQLNGVTPQQLLKEFDESKLEIEGLKEKLDSKPSDQLEESYKSLQKELDGLEQAHRDTLVKLQEKTTLLNKNLKSVIELEQIEKQKQVISKHNELLSVRLNDLSNEVDELINKQQSKTAFPALVKLDSALRSEELTEPVPTLEKFILELQQRIAWDTKEQKELYYRKEDIQLFIAGLAMSRLHILQGISGTGKTSLPKAFARAIGAGNKIISVQAGWRDKGDLIGHFNAFEKKFYEQETLQGLYEAQCPAFKDRLYIILLDEMNLSRPEQYFAEFLSALELAPKDRLLPLMTDGQSGGPELLLDGRVVRIPENVWFIGTANHDETTFEFADKTYDRAHVMELPRHKVNFAIDKNLDKVTYSFSSLEKAFDQAVNKHQKTVKNIVKAMDESEFSECLEKEFNVSWGNRLERHMTRFIPVMLECGSDLGFAVDHLLATKVFRAGKATGRYDTQRSDIEDLQGYLNAFWKEQRLGNTPKACLYLLEQELKKKSDF